MVTQNNDLRMKTTSNGRQPQKWRQPQKERQPQKGRQHQKGWQTQELGRLLKLRRHQE